MFPFIAYIKFIFSATNQHGVHSPFVYNYVTQCLYSKQKYSQNKVLNILLKSIAYFNAQNIHVDSNNQKIMNAITFQYPQSNFNKKPYDIIYVNSMEGKNLKFKNVSNDTMLLINGIHTTSKNESIWEHIKKMDEVQITIDMFHFGTVFFRKEQAKEHFKIRI